MFSIDSTSKKTKGDIQNVYQMEFIGFMMGTRLISIECRLHSYRLPTPFICSRHYVCKIYLDLYRSLCFCYVSNILENLSKKRVYWSVSERSSFDYDFSFALVHGKIVLDLTLYFIVSHQKEIFIKDLLSDNKIPKWKLSLF